MRVPEDYQPHPLLTAPRPTPIDPNDEYIRQLVRRARQGATVSGGLGPNGSSVDVSDRPTSLVAGRSGGL